MADVTTDGRAPRVDKTRVDGTRVDGTRVDGTRVDGPRVGGPHVRILADRCAGCQECLIRCPEEALSMDTARWIAKVDEAACVGCRQCVRTCPFSAIVVEGPVLAGERVTVGSYHAEHLVGDVAEVHLGLAGWPAVLAEANRCLTCPDPTCVRGCPAHNDIPGFVAQLRRRDLAGAHRVLRATTVLPDICSRVCNQAAQCEGACSWALAGAAPVAIGLLERFVADHHPVPPPEVPPPEAGADAGGLSVAIVGTGPAAVGAAWELVEQGATVTVYEKDATPGGLVAHGIPDFTLPAAVAARPWRQLAAAGVEVRLGVEVRPENLGELAAQHDAVIVANGAGQPLRLPVPGADLTGVVDAASLLEEAKAALEEGGDPVAFLAGLGLGVGAEEAPGAPPPRILVLGAGNTAMDVARTARRLGCAATCVDWLDERFALARPDELALARSEGVEVRFSRTLTRLEDDGAGRVGRALLARTHQRRADRRPRVERGAPEVLAVDLVVMAMGYRVDPAFAALLPGTPVARAARGLPDRRWQASGILTGMTGVGSRGAHPAGGVGALALGREACLTASAHPVHERVWVAGDALSGPATVVEAMAEGKRAAQAVLDAGPRPGH